MMFTTVNDSLNLLVTLKIENMKKQHAGTRTNIEKKPHGASLSSV